MGAINQDGDLCSPHQERSSVSCSESAGDGLAVHAMEARLAAVGQHSQHVDGHKSYHGPVATLFLPRSGFTLLAVVCCAGSCRF